MYPWRRIRRRILGCCVLWRLLRHLCSLFCLLWSWSTVCCIVVRQSPEDHCGLLLCRSRDKRGFGSRVVQEVQ